MICRVPTDDEDLVFKALADPTRRLLLDRLFDRDGHDPRPSWRPRFRS